MSKFSQLQANWSEGNFAPLYIKRQIICPLSKDAERSLKGGDMFINAMEDKLARMVELARGHAGDVSLRIMFCRITLTNVSDSAINRNGGKELSYLPEEILRRLAIFPHRHVDITHILSPYGADANKISDLWADPEAQSKWKIHEKIVYYDFHCFSPGTRSKFTIRIDAENLKYFFEDIHDGPNENHRHAYIHCPGRAWDLEAVLKTTDVSFFQETFGKVAALICDTFTVRLVHPILGRK
jgi:hypothetical protein